MKTDTQAIKAIPTHYRGYHFRSRLEARWGVFFDELRLRWQYEPEGFQLPTGPYLPDFYIPAQPKTAGVKYWLEVKPVPSKTYKVFELGHLLEQLPVGCCLDNNYAALVGSFPDPEILAASSGYGYCDQEFRGVVEGDEPYLWCVCPCEKSVGLQYDGRGARIPCACRTSDSDKDYSFNHPLILSAYSAARSARFEHGESGASCG